MPHRREVAAGAARVVPGGERDVDQLLERVPARLAGLELHQVEHLGLPVEQQVVQPQEHRRPFRQRHPGPALLGLAGHGVGTVDVGRRRHRQLGERLTGERRVRRRPVRAGTGDDGLGQLCVLGEQAHERQRLPGGNVRGRTTAEIRLDADTPVLTGVVWCGSVQWICEAVSGRR